jgi:hypothetical protein
MKHGRNVVAVQWPGVHSLKAAREAIEGGSEVEIELPAGTHYMLYRHFHPDDTGGAAEHIETEGNAEILDVLATIKGLEDLARLHAPVKRARYRVHLSSPEPMLRLAPPVKPR